MAAVEEGGGGLEGREDSHKVLHGYTGQMHTYTWYSSLHSNNYTTTNLRYTYPFTAHPQIPLFLRCGESAKPPPYAVMYVVMRWYSLIARFISSQCVQERAWE